MAKYIGMNAGLTFKRTLFTGRQVSPRTQYGLFHGDFKPIRVFEVLPSDTWKIKFSELVRMSTPIAPLMDNIRKETVAFFVPKRIIWNKTKQFYMEAPDKGIAAKVYEPTCGICLHTEDYSDITIAQVASRSIQGSFNMIYSSEDFYEPEAMNILPLWAYAAIYNEYIRNQNYQSSYLWDKDQTGSIVDSNIWTIDGHKFNSDVIEGGSNDRIDEVSQWLTARNDGNQVYCEPLAKVNKDTDLFTSITPWQVKGQPITFPLGADLPLKGLKDQYTLESHDTDTGFAGYLGLGLDGAVADDRFLYFDSDTVKTQSTSSGALDRTNLVADGSKASILISDVIYALAYQDFLTRAAHYGTRYKEYIRSMFGSIVPDLTADVPEYLGRVITPINIDEVLQTTGYAAGSSSTLGQPGANSRTGNTGMLVSKSFTEPGYIIICTYTKHERTYSQSVDELFFKNELLDYYQSPFANISDVPVKKNRLLLGAPDETLGFQEPHYDYKMFRDTCLDFMNPSLGGSLNYWSLADIINVSDDYDVNITAEFLKEDRANIVRCLTTGELGPDYICDAYFECEVSRIVPAHSRLGRL